MATIKDFTNEDKIVLHGSQDDYAITVNGSDSEIYHNQPDQLELIAKVENNTDLNLNEAYFEFIE